MTATAVSAHGKQGFHWQLAATEFPVALEHGESRADIVLKSPQCDVLLVCECKRSNPTESVWSFLPAPESAKPVPKRFVVDRVLIGRHSKAFRVDCCWGEPLSNDVANIAIAFKVKANSQRMEDEAPRESEDVDKVAGQVCRATNGVVISLRKHPGYEQDRYVTVVPIIVTTARLVMADVDLSGARIDSGSIQVDNACVRDVNWLYWQYPMSPSLKHDFADENSTADPQSLLQLLYARTIPVVRSTHLAKFLVCHPPTWFSDIEPLKPKIMLSRDTRGL
ncbi:MAG: hypothetical protein IT432_06120 [Phycisphaerales bacterium]|nr:hypothetical protein [Phycisphaerales bacterium]